MEQKLLTNQMAKRAGVNSETLRFYERKGLIPEPMRTESGYRQYPVEVINQIRFIKQAQNLGFTLKEIKELLAISVATKKQCQQVKSEIDHKLVEVDQKIEKLKEISRALTKLRRKCDEGGMEGSCPILEFLYRGTENVKN